MKLERLHEYLTTAVVMTVGIGLALYCGKNDGSRADEKWSPSSGSLHL
jgi:hypothetical protein